MKENEDKLVCTGCGEDLREAGVKVVTLQIIHDIYRGEDLDLESSRNQGNSELHGQEIYCDGCGELLLDEALLEALQGYGI
jgi:hypothetical protein